MNKPNNFRDLIVWQKSIALATGIYHLTKYFPPEEKFGLVSQIRRAAISIAADIAEGAGRGTRKDFRHFPDIVMGSSFGLETLLTISSRLDLVQSETVEVTLD